jgi:hypothetical protein
MSAAATKSTSSKLGRPKVYAPEDAPVIVPTRIPADFHSALKYLAVVPNAQGVAHGSEIKMYDVLLTRFLEERPFERWVPADWRTCGSIVRYENGAKVDKTSWKQLNVQMKKAMKHQVEMVAAQQAQSVAAFLYSALYWWVYTVNRLPAPAKQD